jgi:hypothetical protein
MVKEITAAELPRLALTEVGASGTVAGVTELLVPDGVLVPIALVAVTLNVYAVPFERPVMMIGDDVLVAVKPPTLEVTV